RRLSGQMLDTVTEFFGQAKKGGAFFAALYELTDKELIGHLTEYPGTELILSNANGKTPDETNAPVRKALHQKMKKGEINIYDRMLGSHIGHNKFVIYTDKSGKPKSVLTGSTNWTATGLCGQTNNMVVIDNEKIATQYLKYWKELKKDKK